MSYNILRLRLLVIYTFIQNKKQTISFIVSSKLLSPLFLFPSYWLLTTTTSTSCSWSKISSSRSSVLNSSFYKQIRVDIIFFFSKLILRLWKNYKIYNNLLILFVFQLLYIYIYTQTYLNSLTIWFLFFSLSGFSSNF